MKEAQRLFQILKKKKKITSYELPGKLSEDEPLQNQRAKERKNESQERESNEA